MRKNNFQEKFHKTSGISEEVLVLMWSASTVEVDVMRAGRAGKLRAGGELVSYPAGHQAPCQGHPHLCGGPRGDLGPWRSDAGPAALLVLVLRSFCGARQGQTVPSWAGHCGLILGTERNLNNA